MSAKLERYTVDPSNVTVEGLLGRLAGMCDGAKEKDNIGFNKPDSYGGKYLAMATYDGHALSLEAVEQALHYLRKYQRQLGGKAFMDEFLDCPNFAMEPTGKAMTYILKTRIVRLSESGKNIVFDFKFNETVKDALKRTFRVRFIEPEGETKKTWVAARRTVDLVALKAFSDQYEFRINPDVLEPIPGEPVTTVATKPTNPRTVMAGENKTMIVKFPYNETIVNELKAALSSDNRTYKADTREWIIPVTEANASAVMTIAHRHGFDVCDRVRTYHQKVMEKHAKIAAYMDGHNVAVVGDKLAVDFPGMPRELRTQLERIAQC